MTDPLTTSIHIAAAPGEVFEFFTEPASMVEWMGEAARLDPQPGGRFEVDIRGTRVRGEYLTVEPPKRVVVSWGYEDNAELPPGASTVEVRLTPDGAGTLVELEHRDLPDEHALPHRVGWDHYLPRLALAGSGTALGPDPGMPDPRS